MTFERSDDFVEALLDQSGESLRTVATYDRDGYEFLYRREDVDTLYTEEMFDEIHDGLILEGLGKDYFESMFAVGELQCALYGFESAYVFHFIGSAYDGLVVSLDADAEIPLAPFTDVCRAGLDAVV